MRNNKSEYFAMDGLREELRQQAVSLAEKLSRSVGRLTSCDRLPCLEYGEEVTYEYKLAEQLFYVQQCRNALERCIGCGGAKLRYRWAGGSVTQTTFRTVGPARVKVTGLVRKAPMSQKTAA